MSLSCTPLLCFVCFLQCHALMTNEYYYHAGVVVPLMSASFVSSSAMQFHFYGKDYQGAAHGTAGILYMLLQFPDWCREPTNDPWIRKTVDRFLSFQFRSGNFPSDSNSRSDDLLHWCHGSPGAVYTLYQAHKVYGDPKFKRSLELALKSIWERGILKKGSGLCHGTSGSAYAFLIAYRHFGSEEYLYNALKMVEVMSSDETKQEVAATWDPQRRQTGVPDFPYRCESFEVALHAQWHTHGHYVT